MVLTRHLTSSPTRPTLLTDLTTTIDVSLRQKYESGSSDPRQTLLLRRSLQLINSILKELASVKMFQGAKVMANVRLHRFQYATVSYL